MLNYDSPPPSYHVTIAATNMAIGDILPPYFLDCPNCTAPIPPNYKHAISRAGIQELFADFEEARVDQTTGRSLYPNRVGLDDYYEHAVLELLKTHLQECSIDDEGYQHRMNLYRRARRVIEKELVEIQRERATHALDELEIPAIFRSRFWGEPEESAFALSEVEGGLDLEVSVRISRDEGGHRLGSMRGNYCEVLRVLGLLAEETEFSSPHAMKIAFVRGSCMRYRRHRQAFLHNYNGSGLSERDRAIADAQYAMLREQEQEDLSGECRRERWGELKIEETISEPLAEDNVGWEDMEIEEDEIIVEEENEMKANPFPSVDCEGPSTLKAKTFTLSMSPGPASPATPKRRPCLFMYDSPAHPSTLKHKDMVDIDVDSQGMDLPNKGEQSGSGNHRRSSTVHN